VPKKKKKMCVMTGCEKYWNLRKIIIICRNEENLSTWNTRHCRNRWKYSKGNRRSLTVKIRGKHQFQWLLTKMDIRNRINIKKNKAWNYILFWLCVQEVQELFMSKGNKLLWLN
jgi:hypothetical protein